jgi:hypothetical protein
LDYLGQHASGVVRALINGTEEEKIVPIVATPADIAVGVNSLDDIDSSKCKEWALKDI